MPAEQKRVVAFVHALLRGGQANREEDGSFSVARGSGAIRLPGQTVRRLLFLGVLTEQAGKVVASDEAAHWARRALADTDGFADQHRVLGVRRDGAIENLAESPLARLAISAGPDGAPFLMPHHLEAGERVRRLHERAQLGTRVTMHYDAGHVPGARQTGPCDVSDMAFEARRALDGIREILPTDCAGVVFDICAELKGLQVVEMERGLPRRSAKLVLRIGLDQLAKHFGMAPVAVGPERGRRRGWMCEGARPG